jgi:arginase
LIGALTAAGVKVHDSGDLPLIRWKPDLQRPKAMNLSAVRETALRLADVVAGAMKAESPALVLGGDCTVEIGTVAGAQRDGSSVGLVYVDLDVDLNPPAESDGALDWTGVAHMLDLPGVEPDLAHIGVRTPMLESSDVFFFAADAITSGEEKTIQNRSIACTRLSEVQASIERSTQDVLRWASRFDRLLIHVDLDVLSYVDFPVAENVRRCPGLKLGELEQILNVLVSADNWSALTIAEANPDHAPDEESTFRRLNAILARAAQGNSHLVAHPIHHSSRAPARNVRPGTS